MTLTNNKEDYYNQIKQLLTKHEFTVNPYRKIQYGLQFLVFKETESILLRIYESKKGITVDFSQTKNSPLSKTISKIITKLSHPPKVADPISSLFKKKSTLSTTTSDPDELIGIDESGKGDYFGPLVIAGVYINPIITEILSPLGIQDSKSLSELRIKTLAKTIQKNTKHIIISIGNESYNEIYESMNNLNHILAWGHAKVIEDTLKQVACKNALSDQFGDVSLIENALIAKGIEINLFQRHRAENNIAVAAASILARNKFITEVQRYEKKFNIKLPKGCSDKTIQAAIQFCHKHGHDQLKKIAKLHFKLTDQIEQSLS
tara:strand:+ start:239 stop:1195 length:957 start_codon:yes stop_codon:yes gene_type:complete